jgi:hypothetical protein
MLRHRVDQLERRGPADVASAASLRAELAGVDWPAIVRRDSAARSRWPAWCQWLDEALRRTAEDADAVFMLEDLALLTGVSAGELAALAQGEARA